MTYKYVKRIIDIIISSILLISLFPLFLLISLLIRIDSKGGVFYLQERVGYKGRTFKIYKFRTMIPNAENLGLKHRVVKNDPRITKVGNFLRKISFDELPQLINILKGEMSLIGPRPSLKFQAEQYTEFQKQRLIVRPGITGLAQSRGRKSLNWDQRIRLDILYVKNYNACIDIWIIWHTIKTLFKSEEVYRESKSWIDKTQTLKIDDKKK